MIKLAILFVILGGISAIPQHHRRQLLQRQAEPLVVQEAHRPKVYEISHQISPNTGDGSFRYHSQTSDGLESEQVGYFANPLQSQVQQGSYTTTDEHGQVVRVNYIADKDGFRPVDQHGVAALPTPPPVPEEQVRAREAILQQQAAIRQQHLGYLRAGYAAHGL